MPKCTTCRGTGIDPWFALTGSACPTCTGTGDRKPASLPRLTRFRLEELAATGQLAQEEVQAEMLVSAQVAPGGRATVNRFGLGPDLIDLDDPPSAFEAA